MEENEQIYQKQLNNLTNSLQEMNLKITQDYKLENILDTEREREEDFEKKYEKIIYLISKYIKIKLCLDYKFRKYKLFKSKRGNIYCSEQLIIPSSLSDYKNKLVIVLTEPKNPFGIFNKSMCLFSYINKGSFLNFVERFKNKNAYFIVPNLYKLFVDDLNISDYLEEMWKFFIQIQLKNYNNIIFICQKTATLYLIKLLSKFPKDFKERVEKLILINSKHFELYKILDEKSQIEFKKKTTNFILSSEPFGTLLYSSVSSYDGCENRSCGTESEEESLDLILSEILNYLN